MDQNHRWAGLSTRRWPASSCLSLGTRPSPLLIGALPAPRCVEYVPLGLLVHFPLYLPFPPDWNPREDRATFSPSTHPPATTPHGDVVACTQLTLLKCVLQSLTVTKNPVFGPPACFFSRIARPTT